MGLLGTILGMITTFQVVALSPGGVKPTDLAAGIKVALYTTAFGLFISIPVQTAYSYLRANVDSYVFKTEVAALDLIDTLLGEAGKR
jgi:biopolymer transport protein ExbB